MDRKEEQIRQLAHKLWLEEGKPEGRAQEHWHRAQKLIESEEVAAKASVPAAVETTKETKKPARGRKKVDGLPQTVPGRKQNAQSDQKKP
jgi:hypothetical protein